MGAQETLKLGYDSEARVIMNMDILVRTISMGICEGAQHVVLKYKEGPDGFSDFCDKKSVEIAIRTLRLLKNE